MDSLASPGRLRQIPYDVWKDDPSHRERPINYPVLEERNHLECKIVGFERGGFELSCRTVDVQERIDREMRPRGVPAARKPIEQRSEVDKERAQRRARRMVRWACRQIGAQYLLTLTTRQSENTPEELAEQWKRFCRLAEFKLGHRLVYVAVPERHPSNPKHWHLHVALPAFLSVNIARPLWWACCGGRGQGNIDIKYIKVRDGLGVGERARRVAAYLSKYMSKDLVEKHRPDKKNYWRSRFEMPGVRRYFLTSRPGAWSELLREVADRFGVVLDFSDKGGFFLFPDMSGFWYCHYAGKPGQSPPPF